MKRAKYLASMMTRAQKETYAKIVAEKKYIAKGNYKHTCRILMQLGLIIQNPNTNEYVLKGKPISIPYTEKLPFIKEITGEPDKLDSHMPQVDKPVLRPVVSPAVYSNISREQHIEKWIGTESPTDVVLPLKSLSSAQMDFIVANYKNKTTQMMADHLKVDVLYVRMFCQLNGFETLNKRKKNDTYHTIPHERKLRMNRIGYNQQKKTA